MDSSSSRTKKAEKGTKRKLNLDGLDTSVWLIKIPSSVADFLAGAKSDEVIGHLMKVSTSERQMLSVSLDTKGDCPKDFFLEEFARRSIAAADATPVEEEPSMYAFSSDDHEAYKIDGKITKRLNLEPKLNKAYAEYRTKKNKGEKTTRPILKLDEDGDYLGKMNSHSQDVGFQLTAKGEQMQKQRVVARTRSVGTVDKDALKTTFFEAFSRQERMTKNDLCVYCGEIRGFTPKALEDLLEEYADLHRKGIYKSYYELKPQFKMAVVASVTSNP